MIPPRPLIKREAQQPPNLNKPLNLNKPTNLNKPPTLSKPPTTSFKHTDPNKPLTTAFKHPGVDFASRPSPTDKLPINSVRAIYQYLRVQMACFELKVLQAELHSDDIIDRDLLSHAVNSLSNLERQLFATLNPLISESPTDADETF